MFQPGAPPPPGAFQPPPPPPASRPDRREEERKKDILDMTYEEYVESYERMKKAVVPVPNPEE